MGVRIPGPGRDRGPLAAAEEDYAHRAYPAADVPFQATLAAREAWTDIRARRSQPGRSGEALSATGPWTLVGPSMANFPDVLTFSGVPYTASGRITALVADPACNVSSCRVWAGAAGGGVWRTDNVLASGGPSWTFVSGSFSTNAIGTLTYHAATGTLYAGTGEPNASADSEAGFGIYKSTNGGNSWTLLNSTVGPITTTSPGTGTNGTYTGNAFAGRSISSIVVDPTNSNHLYVSSSRGVRGISAVSGGATTNPTTPRPPFGLFESSDGGATFNFIWDGSDGPVFDGTNTKATIRGVNEVALDPGWNGTTNKILYAGAFGPTGVTGSGGVWRSNDGGATWTQIKSARNVGQNTDRAEFAVTMLPNGNTRMYAGIGNASTASANQAHLYRSDNVAAGTPTFTDMTAAESPAGQSVNYCTGQCWYDNVVYSPPGRPDVVYLGGSYDYGTFGLTTNGRAFLRSTNAGASFTDMTWDSATNSTPPDSCCQSNPISPNGQHPDSHAIVEIPGTDIAVYGGDGGLMRSSGAFANISSQCTSPRGLSGSGLALCQQLLSAVPTALASINTGLSTLQFQSLSVAANNSSHLQGGTQDNGTFEGFGSTVTWPQVIYGDGGQSGFNASNSALRFNSFTSNAHDVNFQNGNPTKWVIASGPIRASGESALFYAPIIADPNPASAGTIFEGSLSVWRTQDWAGNQAFLEANCPEFTTSSADPTCGDFVAIGPSGATNLTASAADYRGTTRSGGNVAAIARTPSDASTLWVATSIGRVFISKNANNATPGNVTYTRLDPLDDQAPSRFISSIYIDPADSNHAWISYSGYAYNTPAQPGHIFTVTYNPGGGTADWTNIDGTGPGIFPDFPASAVVADSNGDLYAANDWGVLRLPKGAVDWEVAGTGLPQVEITGLTIVPSARKLFASTHGRSAWQLALPLELVSAASRLTHGGAGTFDVDLPLTGSPGVECRSNGSNNFTIVLHLNNTLVAGSASVTAHNPSGAGTVGSVSFSGSDMLVNLTGVTDKQILTLTSSNLSDVNGTNLASVAVNIGFLIGDTNQSKTVNSSDVSQTKSQSGATVTASNFREDVTADGAISATDVSTVKLKSGNGLP